MTTAIQIVTANSALLAPTSEFFPLFQTISISGEGYILFPGGMQSFPGRIFVSITTRHNLLIQELFVQGPMLDAVPRLREGRAQCGRKTLQQISTAL